MAGEGVEALIMFDRPGYISIILSARPTLPGWARELCHRLSFLFLLYL